MFTQAQKAFIDIEGDFNSKGFEIAFHHSKQTSSDKSETFRFFDGSQLTRFYGSNCVYILGGYTK